MINHPIVRDIRVNTRHGTKSFSDRSRLCFSIKIGGDQKGELQLINNHCKLEHGHAFLVSAPNHRGAQGYLSKQRNKFLWLHCPITLAILCPKASFITTSYGLRLKAIRTRQTNVVETHVSPVRGQKILSSWVTLDMYHEVNSGVGRPITWNSFQV